MTDTRRHALCSACLVFAVATPPIYALMRLYELARAGSVDPRLILLSTHTGFYWRCALAAWAGSMLALFAYLWAREKRERSRRAAQRVSSWAVLAIGAFALVAWRYP